MQIMSYPRVYLQNDYWMVELARNQRKALSAICGDIPKGEAGRKKAMAIEKELKDRRNAQIINDLMQGKRQEIGQYIDNYLEIRKQTASHMMRHSCASHIMLHGGNIKHVKELLGHSQLSTTERYAKIAMENLSETVERVDKKA